MGAGGFGRVFKFKSKTGKALAVKEENLVIVYNYYEHVISMYSYVSYLFPILNLAS